MTFFELQRPFDMEPIAMDLPAAERSLVAFQQMATPMRDLRDALRAEMIPADPEMPFTADQRDHNERKLHDIDVLERGAWGLGFNDSRLRPFAGGPADGVPRHPRDGAPGLKLIEHWITFASKTIAQEQAMRAMEWPAQFRYRGPAGSAAFNGKRLRVGDVVTFTSRTQFAAFGDRFEAVEQEQPVTT